MHMAKNVVHCTKSSLYRKMSTKNLVSPRKEMQAVTNRFSMALEKVKLNKFGPAADLIGNNTNANASLNAVGQSPNQTQMNAEWEMEANPNRNPAEAVWSGLGQSR
jgi:hypothetical protein